VNFRSDHSCGSLLVAAKEAYMEGRQHHSLYKPRSKPPAPDAPPSPPPPSPVLEKHERWLVLDDVSAHVVPLDVEVNHDLQWLQVRPTTHTRIQHCR
jgi:hypothetical protein